MTVSSSISTANTSSPSPPILASGSGTMRLPRCLARLGSCAPVAHYTPKQRFTAALSAAPFCSSAVPLVGIYVLDTRDDGACGHQSPLPKVSQLAEREALMTLLSLAFKLDIRDHRMLTREFDFLHRLVTHIPVRRLTVPDSFTALPAVQAAVLHDLAMSC